MWIERISHGSAGDGCWVWIPSKLPALLPAFCIFLVSQKSKVPILDTFFQKFEWYWYWQDNLIGKKKIIYFNELAYGSPNLVTSSDVRMSTKKNNRRRSSLKQPLLNWTADMIITPCYNPLMHLKYFYFLLYTRILLTRKTTLKVAFVPAKGVKA